MFGSLIMDSTLDHLPKQNLIQRQPWNLYLNEIKSIFNYYLYIFKNIIITIKLTNICK